LPDSGYEFLPHTTDAYVAARGETLERALQSAGTALFDVMCYVQKISPKVTDEVDVEGFDEMGLLYNWLESLLLKFDLEGKVYSKFEVTPIVHSDGRLRTRAKMMGELYDRAKHGAKVEVKAVTYHKMEITRNERGVTLKFILDL